MRFGFKKRSDVVIKMLLVFLATFCIASAKVLDGGNDVEELRWANVYTVKGTKISFTTGIVEDYTAWKSKLSSRVDYDNGAVKVITKLKGKYRKTSIKYQIFPKTTAEVLNEIMCQIMSDEDDEYVTLDVILPEISDIDDYEAVGNETINDRYTTRFEYDNYGVEETKKIIWAEYDDDAGWIPVKFEEKKFNPLLGSFIGHDIYEYFDYKPIKYNKTVFNTNKYNCDSESATKVAKESEKITKELLFVDTNNKKHLSRIFNHFKDKYNKQYAHEREHALRKSIFEKKVRMISSFNKRNLSYKLGVNEFSDWTPEEIKRSHGAFPRPKGIVGTTPFPYKESEIDYIVEKLPKEYDMRLLGLISPIKHQGTCGSCWTFAAASAIESGLARHNGGRVLGLSNQAILDCAYEGLGFEGGCSGGFDYSAYDFVMEHGVPTEEEYGPYKNQNSYCNIGNMTKTYSIRGFTDVIRHNINAMKVALVNNGALYVHVNAGDEFYSYSSGVFYQTSKECEPDQTNHAVTLVGYGERYGELFWILRNSWGVNWGMQGYMLIAAGDNVCGVESHASYPVF